MSEPVTVTSIRELKAKVGESASLGGWIDNKRSSGKIAFLQIRLAGGTVQAVASRNDLAAEAWAEVERVTQESTVRLTGVVKEDKRSSIGVEIQLTGFSIFALTEDFPI